MVLACYLLTTAVGPNTVVSTAMGAQRQDTSPRLVLETGGHTAVINGLIFTDDGRELDFDQ